jgi:uncharacterized protein (TIGR02145 family)
MQPKQAAAPTISSLCILLAVAVCATAPAAANGRRGVESALSMQVGPGWNLLSLPVIVSDGSRLTLFPTSTSQAFVARDSGGYEPQDTLCPGVGFWLKFDSAQTVPIEGALILGDTVEVNAGWNLIGCLSVPVIVDSLKTNPPGILSGQVFEFRREGEGYRRADTLSPGLAYWMKAARPGLVVLAAGAGPPCPGIPNVSYAGKTYHTVLVGSRCWLKENLDVGAMVNGSEDQTDNSIIEKYCYGDDGNNCNAYGGLYQWREAMQYLDSIQGVKGICPPGWHLPTVADFGALSLSVNGDGNALKAVGQGSSAGAGTNTSGFSALMAGYRDTAGIFQDLGGNAAYWSSTGTNASMALCVVLSGLNPVIVPGDEIQPNGFSVRCVGGDAPNVFPSPPDEPLPPDRSTEVSLPVALRWSCSDPDGGALTYDVYFGTANPPVDIVSSGQSDTTLVRSELHVGTRYYWEVVATDGRGGSTAGPVWSFATMSMNFPCPGIPTVTYAGKTYNTVHIGRQCWLKENLDVGTMIPGQLDQVDNSVLEKYCYDDDTLNCNLYGGLYQWREAMQYRMEERTQGICPPGWRLPTGTEFIILAGAVGGNGNALKAIGEGAGPGAGTNVSGFSGLLAGVRWTEPPGFGAIHGQVGWWSTTPWGNLQASFFGLQGSSSDGGTYVNPRNSGWSIRCLLIGPPDSPLQPSPQDGAAGIPLSTTLSWSCNDPDGNPLTYDVYLGTSQFPNTRIATNCTDTTLRWSGLAGATLYYWKVVAKDGPDSVVGPVWRFWTSSAGLPCPGMPKITYDGKVYHTVKIGSQCWMKENLDVGAMVPGSENPVDDGVIQKYCFDNNPANCDTFGALYQWQEAMQYDTTQGGQGVCPPGWHVPTSADMQTLNSVTGGDGNVLKAIGEGAGDGAGTNTSGFSALLAGRRSPGGSFENAGGFAYFWSSTRYDGANAIDLLLHSGSAYVLLPPHGLNNGFSVRCLMPQISNFPPDEPSNPSPGTGAANVPVLPTLTWGAWDPDGDPLSFDVYFGTVNPPDTVISANHIGTSLALARLRGGTTYYWRVAARDDHGHVTMGSVWSFSTLEIDMPCPGMATVDYAGKTYNTVQIAGQCWLKENLDVGTMIHGSQNSADNGIIEKYCYNDDTANCNTYGGLYQWNEMMNYTPVPGTLGICPPGWHVPVEAEYPILSVTVGGDGNSLKAVGQGTGIGAGTNTSGFSALLAAYRGLDGHFNDLGHFAFFWCSTLDDAGYARSLTLPHDNAGIFLHLKYKNLGLGVRCLKD